MPKPKTYPCGCIEQLDFYLGPEEAKDEHWTTIGNVRGCCGHRHKTLHTAAECMRADQRGCKQQGGYSDRRVLPVPDRPLTDDEAWAIYDWENHRA